MVEGGNLFLRIVSIVNSVESVETCENSIEESVRYL